MVDLKYKYEIFTRAIKKKSYYKKTDARGYHMRAKGLGYSADGFGSNENT